MPLSFDDVEQIGHVARLAVFAMCARAVAGHEFEQSPEVQQVRVTVTRPAHGEQAAIDVEFLGTHPMPIGGMSL
jgi:hypothetical protein